MHRWDFAVDAWQALQIVSMCFNHLQSWNNESWWITMNQNVPWRLLHPFIILYPSSWCSWAAPRQSRVSMVIHQVTFQGTLMLSDADPAALPRSHFWVKPNRLSPLWSSIGVNDRIGENKPGHSSCTFCTGWNKSFSDR
jgi:hypothetical protein